MKCEILLRNEKAQKPRATETKANKMQTTSTSISALR